MYKTIFLTLLFCFSLKAEEADHLIFSKITITPNQAEMVAIYNPTSSTIDLSNYYLSDAEYSPANIHYYNLPSGTDYIWSFASTDFVVRFKDTDEIDPGETKYISLAGIGDFENYYGFAPDLIMQNDMLSAIDGQNSISTQTNLLGDSYEVLILFYWDGNPNSLVQDVDYFYWGNYQALAFYGVNKTGVSTYAPDTPFLVADLPPNSTQRAQEENILNFHTDGYTYKRVSLTEEVGELGPTNSITGNGITLHDETSENFTISWEIVDEIGCMNQNDPNYNPDAIIDDGSCLLKTISVIVNNCSYDADDTIECDGEYDLTNSSANECPLYETPLVTTGIVVDYFDIEPYGGPRSFTLRDENNNFVDFVVWKDSNSYQDGFDITQTALNVLTDPDNFGLYEVQISGELGVFCDDDQQLNILNEWQITVEYEADITILQKYNSDDFGCADSENVNYNPDALIDDGSCITMTIEDIVTSSTENFTEFTTSIMGIIVGYGDYREPNNGPQVIELQDDNGFEIDLVVWEDDWVVMDSDIAYMIDHLGLTEYVIVATGEVGVYEGSFQFTVSTAKNIKEFESYGVGGEFIEDESITKAEINPAPYVFIPSIGEVIDYSFSFPANSRVTIRILDFNGRFVTSLVDKFYQVGGTVNRNEDKASWDGRNSIGQIVPPGTYLMHIESTMWETGKSSTDIAPVVVGVYK